MADVEQPLGRPLLSVRTESNTDGRSPTSNVVQKLKSGASTTGAGSPSAPSTPEQDRKTDPLGAHILARAQSSHVDHADAPYFKRNLSEISGFIKDTAANIRDEIVAPSASVSTQTDAKDVTGADGASASKPNHEAKHVSFFAKLRGKTAEPEYRETEDEVQRQEGVQAEAFCGGAHRPKYIRVRSQGKHKRDFNNLFLAQQLSMCPSASSNTEQSSTNSKTAGSPTHGQRTENATWALKFSKDGKYLAAGGQDGIVRVWRVLSTPNDRREQQQQDTSGLYAPIVSSRPYRVFEGHSADILDISWSTRNFLLTSSMDKTVRLWHVSRDECLCCFQHRDFVTSIAFHPKDDRYFLSGSLDCKLRLWDIVDKQVAFWNEIPELITAVNFSSDGRLAIAGTFTGLCLFYETEGLRYHTQILVRSSRGRNSKGSKITGIEVASGSTDLATSETRLLITSNDSRTRLYTMRDKALESKFKGNTNQSSQIRASFSDGCRYVVCGSEDRQVYIWNTRGGLGDGKDKRGYEHFHALDDVVTATCFAPNATRELLLASKDPIYERVNIPKQPPQAGSNSSILTGRSSATEDTYLNPADGNIVVCADAQGSIKIFRQDSIASLLHAERSDTIGSLLKRKSTVARPSSVADGAITRTASDASMHQQYKAGQSLTRTTSNTSARPSTNGIVVTPKSTRSKSTNHNNPNGSAKSGAKLSPTAERAEEPEVGRGLTSSRLADRRHSHASQDRATLRSEESGGSDAKARRASQVYQYDNLLIDEQGVSMAFYDPKYLSLHHNRPRALSTSTFGGSSFFRESGTSSRDGANSPIAVRASFLTSEDGPGMAAATAAAAAEATASTSFGGFERDGVSRFRSLAKAQPVGWERTTSSNSMHVLSSSSPTVVHPQTQPSGQPSNADDQVVCTNCRAIRFKAKLVPATGAIRLVCDACGRSQG
ncbi:hypothetical protein PYCC9005_001165 [Savitreella phatthalungensis]